jgi:hypothetical protein
MAVVDQTYIEKKATDSQILYLDEAVEGLHSADGLRVSEAEYWETYYHDPDFRYEWNNGILEEKPMADYLSFEMYRWFLKLLEEYLPAHPIATMIGLDIEFRLALPDKTSIRRPDLALILHTNSIPIDNDDCTYQGIFDLCIEFLSDSTPKEAKRDTVVKKGGVLSSRRHRVFHSGSEGQEHGILPADRGRRVCADSSAAWWSYPL